MSTSDVSHEMLSYLTSTVARIELFCQKFNPLQHGWLKARDKHFTWYSWKYSHKGYHGYTFTSEVLV